VYPPGCDGVSALCTPLGCPGVWRVGSVSPVLLLCVGVATGFNHEAVSRKMRIMTMCTIGEERHEVPYDQLLKELEVLTEVTGHCTIVTVTRCAAVLSDPHTLLRCVMFSSRAIRTWRSASSRRSALDT